MKFRPRSFPHPVLGNGDDVPEAGFQVIFDVRHDKTFYYLDSHFQVSSNTLLELVKDRRATYVMHVECGTTFFRHRYQYSQLENIERIPADELREAVEVNHFITAIQDIKNYCPDGVHTDYAGSTFDIRKGDILGIIVPGQRFVVEKDYDSLQSVGSIVQIDPSKEQDAPMKVDLAQSDKIRIVLSKEDYSNYLLLRAKPEMVPMLHSTIVLPALMEAIKSLNDPDDADSDDLRWRQNLRDRIDKMGSGLDDFAKAQKLLERPLNRTLSALKAYAEAAS